MKAILKTINTFTESRLNEWLLLARLSVGPIFIQAGLSKLINFDKTVNFFTSIQIPFSEISTVLAAGTELAGGLLLILGLWSRIICLPLAFIMCVALITAHGGDIHSLLDLFTQKAWIYLIIFFVLSGTGAGKWSLDQKINPS